MDTPDRDVPPFPPLPLGEGVGVPTAPTASTDALRAVLARHRRRQATVAAGALAVVLVAGSLAGFAAGRSGRGRTSTQVAASAPNAAAATAAGGPARGAPTPAIAVAGSGGGSGVGGAYAYGGGPATQLLVRDAIDGTRVRLYDTTIPTPIGCPVGAMCAQPAMAPCQPSGLLTAEVSDDQVAGETGAMDWTTTTGPAGAQVLAATVVGAGQPQPILVVVARTGPGVGTVKLDTPFGSDSATPTGTWSALAVRLPSDFATSGLGSSGLPTGTVSALSPAGATLSSTALSDAAQVSQTPPCGGPIGVICDSIGTAPASPPLPAPNAPPSTTAASNAAGVAPAGPAPVATCERCSPVTAAPGPGSPTPTVAAPPPGATNGSPGAVGGGATIAPGTAGGSGGAAGVMCSSATAVAGSGASSGPATTSGP